MRHFLNSPGRGNTLLKLLLIVLGSSWLLAPAIHGDHYGTLHLISNYEGYGQPWSWAFRTGDILASFILVILILRYHLWQKDRLMATLLLVFAVLAAADAVLALSCQGQYIGHCIRIDNLSNLGHYLESALTPLVAAAAITLDIFRRRRAISALFLGSQIMCAALVAGHVITDQPTIMLQFLYEVALLVWLPFALEAYATDHRPRPLTKWYFTALALWVGLSGMLAIVVAAGHLRLYGPNISLYIGHFGERPAWLSQQAVIVGVLLLYLARQIYRRQRRAAYILVLIFGFELMKYSLIEPHPVLAAIYGVTFALIFVTRHSFTRNIGPPDMHRRLYDVLTVCGGVATALIIVIVILFSFGRLQHAVNLLDNGSDYLAQQYDLHRKHIPVSGQRVQQTVAILAGGTAVMASWSLFRPKRLYSSAGSIESEKLSAQQLLTAYSTSSEDFFKLWPDDKQYFFGPGGQSFIAYKLIGSTAFALADPVAPSLSDCRELLKSFDDFCHMNGWTACFLPVGKRSEMLYKPGFKLIRIGASAVINIYTFNSQTKREKWWRWQNNRGTKAGLSYECSLPPHPPALLQELRNVSDAWLTRAGRREQGFALGYFDTEYLNNCRVHYLTNAGHVVAFTNELPIFRGSQTTIDLLRYTPNHSGAMPYLLMSVIEQLGKEGTFETFDLGFVPLAKLSSPPAQLVKAIAGLRFSAAGLEQFKGKFKPEWTPVYLAYSGDIMDLASLALKLETALKL